ncbi:hypothetical protein [Nocardia asiatica]|uniref:hypothetical protein n=1 Tax=Nocardia asiatica TaxID=209252 RepID=UPI003EE3D943
MPTPGYEQQLAGCGAGFDGAVGLLGILETVASRGSGPQRAGHISGHLEPGRTAATIVATVQGGVTILMSPGDVTHLEAALDTLLTLLKTSTRTPSDRMSDIAD